MPPSRFLKEVPFTYLCMPPLIKKDWSKFKELCEKADMSQVGIFALATRILHQYMDDERFASWVMKVAEDYPKRKPRDAGPE